MCGIAGMVAPGRRLDLAPMLAALAHRGPDGCRQHIEGAAAIGSTRLAVRDVAGGTQPMVEAGLALAFNGEIYNDAALRTALEARGHRFRTRCDTETVLRGWLEWGAALLPRLEGMFAFAVLEPDRLTLVRDRSGIKPLYHAMPDRRGPFVFASEIPAILRSPAVPRSLNLRALADFAAIGYPTGSDTFFGGVLALEPGHMLQVEWRDGVVLRQTAWCDKDDDAPEAEAHTSERLEDAFSEALEAAVRSHLVADGPVAVALSGGLDSSVLACAAAAEARSPPACFTVCDDRHHPDAVAAIGLAEALGAPHHLHILGFEDFLAGIPATLLATAAPDLGPGPAFLALCQVIGRTHKVALNGEGADEMLCGYRSFLDPDGTLREIVAGFARAARAGLLPSRRATEIRDRLAEAGRDKQAFRSALRREYCREQLVRCHLEPVDHIAMAASVEMRVPYLDAAVRRVAAATSRDGHLEVTLGLQKRTLRHFALRRFGPPLYDVALRPKLEMPDAGRTHLKRFAALADDLVGPDLLRRAPLASAFADRTGFLTFELFRHIHLTGELRVGDDIRAALPDLLGAPV